MSGSSLKYEIYSLPKDLQSEVADFVEFLKSKQSKRKKSRLKSRQFGFAKGKIHLAPDFDAALQEFSEYM